MRKIKYKKGKKVQPTLLEYTGVHKYTQTEIQLFVYNTNDLAEFSEFEISEIPKHVDYTKTNWLLLLISGHRQTQIQPFLRHARVLATIT